jgi:hypothetical protein
VVFEVAAGVVDPAEIVDAVPHVDLLTMMDLTFAGEGIGLLLLNIAKLLVLLLVDAKLSVC